jgi:predicted membrane protein
MINEEIINPQKKALVKLLLMLLAVILVITGVVIALKSKNKSKEEKPKKAIETSAVPNKVPGKVVEIENLKEELPVSPEVIAQGKFINVEQEVLGKALFIKSGEETMLRFEDFNVINGQDLHVYLSPIQGIEKNDMIDLGLLKATSGNFNYSLDIKVDIAKYKNVLIWSNTFDAFFGYAGLYAKELPSETPRATEALKATEEATKKQ